MAWVLPAMAIAGTVLGVTGSLQQGDAEKKSANFQAQQLEQNAGQYKAGAQREAGEQRRQARLANSRLRALAGGGGGDETIVHLSQDITGEGELRALTAMYEGDERARSAQLGAIAQRFEGDQAKHASKVRAISTVLGSASSLYSAGNTLYSKYGKGGAMDQTKYGLPT